MNENLIPYHDATIRIAVEFEHLYIEHNPGRYNTHTDVLASLATSLAQPAEMPEKVLVFSRYIYCTRPISQKMIDKDIDFPSIQVPETSISTRSRDWLSPIIDYVMYGSLPNKPNEAAAIFRKFMHFNYDPKKQTPCCLTRDGVLLSCLSPQEARKS